MNFTIKTIIAVLLCFFISNTSINAQDLVTAQKYTVSERYEEAHAIYKSLIIANPKNADVYYYLGENILKEYLTDPFSNSITDVISQAREVFTKGVAADSINPLNYIGLGMVVLMEKNDTLLADSYFKKAEFNIPKKAKKLSPENKNTLVKLGLAQLYGKNIRFNKAIAYLEFVKLADDKYTDAFLALGDVYLNRDEPSPAMLNYNRALYLNPQLVEVQVKIAKIYMRSRNLTEAISFLNKAKDIDSTYAPLYKGLGETYSMANKYKFAKQNYKKFLDLSGNNIPAKVSYVTSLFKAKDYAEVLNQIEEILLVDQSRTYLYRLAAYSSFEKRIPDLEKKPAEYAKEKLNDYVKGLQYIETFFAKSAPSKIISKDYAYYGRLQLKVKADSMQIEKGFENLLKAYKNDTTDVDLLSELAVNAYFQKKFNLAINMLNNKIALDKASENDYMYLGKAYYQIARYGMADTVFTKVTSIYPENMQAWLWIANTYASLDPESKEGLAKPKYELVIQKASSDSVKYAREMFEAYSYLASYFVITKPDFDNGVKYAQRIINLDPKNIAWVKKGYSLLGIIYTNRKEYVKAKGVWEKVKELDPKNAADAQKAIDGINKALKAIAAQQQ